MTIHSLRPVQRPDNCRNQVRASQSLARRLYLLILTGSAAWICMLVFGPMIFMDADGMIVQRHELVTPPYAAQVVSVDVRPGDRVRKGQTVAHVLSTQMIDLLSDLSSRKSQFDARDEQIKARLSAIEAMMPLASQRVKDADAAMADVAKAMAGGYGTTTRTAEFARERYDALRELASIRAERAGLESERIVVRGNEKRLADALAKARRTYQDGLVTSSVDGIVGPRVATSGSVLSPGGTIAEIHYGRSYVLAYLPTDRFYSAAPGQDVIVTDGVNRQTGRLDRIERIADQLPAEFQSSFRSIQRQQLAVIRIAGGDVFPLLAKVKVTSPYSPSNLIVDASKSLFASGRSTAVWGFNRAGELIAQIESFVEAAQAHAVMAHRGNHRGA